MIKVLSAAEMREVDRLTADECGIPSIILMENAARAVADSIERRLGRQIASALIVCGKGNNGGDGAALARILHHRGAAVSVYAVGALADRRGDARVNFDAIARINSPSFRLREVSDTDPDWCDELDEILIGFDVVVDALFGTGLTRPLTGVFARIVELLKFAQASVNGPLYVAIECLRVSTPIPETRSGRIRSPI